MKIMKIFIALCALFISISNCRIVEKSVSVYIIEEQVNGIRFTHRSDYIDGKAQELWAINSKVATQCEYEEAILDAEKEERRLVRKLEEQKRKQEQEFKLVAHTEISKKLITIKVQEITQELVKIKEPLLEPFLRFSQETIASKDTLSNIMQQIEHARLLCQTNDNDTYVNLQECLKTLELYPEKLALLYQESVNYAIKTCDNTRALKDILLLVS